MALNYGKLFSRKLTPQHEPIPGSAQVQNSAGGFAWAVDDWIRLDRFLLLGTEGGSYYASERKLTRQNAEAAERCVRADGERVVRRVVEISDAGRAPRNDPAIFVLAMAAKLGDFATRRAALGVLPKVCRTGTHLLHFAEYVQAFGGWGRGTRSAVARWYTDKAVDKLAYQLVKYQQRDGWSHRDLLRLAHPKPPTIEHDALFRWTVTGQAPGRPKPARGPSQQACAAGGTAAEAPYAVTDGLRLLDAFEKAKAATGAGEIARLVREHDLPRECIPTEWLGDADVWAALLERMPVTALIRNLATMTRVGLLAPMSAATATVLERLGNAEKLAAARVHPIGVLAALITYKAGQGVRGQHTWTPVGQIVDALDGAFYAAFRSVQPAGKRTLLALDVSGSMESGTVAGVPGLTPRVASAAMALVTAATEQQHAFVAFTSGKQGVWSRLTGGNGGSAARGGISELDISPRWRLDEVVERVSGLPFSGTDCALPMLWALAKRVEVDTFVIYTDSETWAGAIHPAQALAEYRRDTGIPAKLVVVGMVSNGFSIADPNDAGMLDVVGFDTAAPAYISDFARG